MWRPGFDFWVGKIPWRRKWQPTPVFLPGKFHGQRSLAGYSSWGCKESDMTEHACLHGRGSTFWLFLGQYLWYECLELWVRKLGNWALILINRGIFNWTLCSLSLCPIHEIGVLKSLPALMLSGSMLTGSMQLKPALGSSICVTCRDPWMSERILNCLWESLFMAKKGENAHKHRLQGNRNDLKTIRQCLLPQLWSYSIIWITRRRK